jgi:hypothetical protein
MPFDIDAGGTGRPEDVDLVAAELARLPEAIAAELRKQKIRVVACRDAVTDFAPELADPGEVPEGWPEGSTWTEIPGAYIPARHAVVIATRGPDAGGPRRVPAYGEGHGARSLAVHETVHGYDYGSKHLKSLDPVFRKAWKQDLPLLGAAYFTGSVWGPRESYAESAAQHFGVDQSQAHLWPHLATFWSQFQPFAPTLLLRLSAAVSRLLAPLDSRRPPLGLGAIETDGTIHLDLTATSKSGALGHGRLTYRPGETRYEMVLRHIAPGRASTPVTERASEPETRVLVRPFGTP